MKSRSGGLGEHRTRKPPGDVCPIRNTEEVFPAYAGHFEAVELLQSSPCQQSLHSPAQSVVSSPGRHRGRDFAGHEEQASAFGPNSAIEAYALGNPERAPIPEVRFAFHCERLEVR